MGAYEFAERGNGPGRVLAFPSASFIIGSGPDAQLRFEPRLVQGRHAEISVDPAGTAWVTDLSNGLTWLNGVPVTRAALEPGALLRFGRLELLLRYVSSEDDEEETTGHTARRPSPFGSRVADDTLRDPPPPPARPGPPAAVLPPGQRPPVPAEELTQPISGEFAAVLSGMVSAAAARPPADLAHRALLVPGAIVSQRYRIVEKIAVGGMGEVYRAEHVGLGKHFALKVMLAELSTGEDLVNRFRREAISASRIGQQNIVDITDFGATEDGRFYFVMEYLDGVTLTRLLREVGRLTPARAVNIALQVARALAAAHQQGIIHRDMKPDNVMVLQRPGQPDFVKVLDFGVAKVMSGPAQGGQTLLGVVVGTPQYMSPEQARGLPVDTRTDLYALGLVLYELLAGFPAFHADTVSMVMVKQVTEPPPPFVPEVAAFVPAALARLIFQLLEKDPGSRPTSTTSVVETLEALALELKVSPRAVPAPVGGHPPPVAGPPTPLPPRAGVATPHAGFVAGPLPHGAEPVAGPLPGAAPSRSQGVPSSMVQAALAGPSRSQGVAQAAVHAAAGPGPLGSQGLSSAAVRQAAGAGPSPSRSQGLAAAPVEQALEVPAPRATEVNGAAVDAPAVPRSSWPRTVLGAAVLLAVAVGIGALIAPAPRPGPPSPAVVTPAPTPEPRSLVTLTVDSEPTGAEVFEKGQLLGKTPLQLKRPAQTLVELTLVAEGHQKLVTEVQVPLSERRTVIQLEPGKQGE